MKVHILLLVAILVTITTAQESSRFRQLSASELREIELRHDPELLATVARTAETVIIVLDSALTGAFVQEIVNANIDCFPWLSNFPGGEITWLKQRFIVNQETGVVEGIEHQSEIQTFDGGRLVIGGDSDRWLNITATNIIQGREDADHGNYTCRVCVGQGTPFERCHDATVTVYLPGAPPVINDTDSNIPDDVDPVSGLTTYRIGADFCIERGMDLAFRLECDILERDLANGIPGPRPTPLRTFVKDGVVVYNTTQGLNPIDDINDEFNMANMILIPGQLMPQVFLPTNDGAITLITQVTNASRAGLSESVARDMLFDIYIGEWTCTASNAYGSDTATTHIRECEPLLNATCIVNEGVVMCTSSFDDSVIPVSYECSIDGGDKQPCDPPFSIFDFNLASGSSYNLDIFVFTPGGQVQEIESGFFIPETTPTEPPLPFAVFCSLRPGSTDDSQPFDCIVTGGEVETFTCNYDNCTITEDCSDNQVIDFSRFGSGFHSLVITIISTDGQEASSNILEFFVPAPPEPTVSTETDVVPSTEYPYDPYEPEDTFDPYPFYYCELNEDEYGRPYYGPYDQHIPPSLLTTDSLQSPPTELESSPMYYIPPRPYVAESPSIRMYTFNLRRLTNSRKSDVLTMPSCILSNECSNSPEQCFGDSTQYDSCGRRCTCKDGQLVDCCRVRKEWRSMTQVERCHYVHVIHLVSTRNPWKKCYDALINIHEDRFRSGIHEREFFLPFHRWYILALENLLRQVDCNITVPYWDWSLEPQSWQKSTIWAAECGFGGDGDPSNNYHVKNGDFSQSNNWQLASAAGGSLRRQFSNENVPDCATVAMIQRTGIAEFNTWNNFVSSNLHDSIHCNIGGTMCTSSTANAPEFFLTQGFIDQIWASWQNKGYSFKNLPFFSKNDNLMPGAFGYSPADVYDLDSQPGCVKICIEASSRPCRINTTYTPMCPLSMMQSDYSPIKLANAIPKPYPYVPEASNSLFERPFEIQRSANRFSTLLNKRNELQSVLENSGYGTGANGYHPTRGEIQFDRYIYQPELVYPDTFAPNGTRLGPPRECQQYLTECP